MSPTLSMENATPYMRALCCSRKVHSCSRFSSGWRQTNASTRSACSPANQPAHRLELLGPGQVDQPPAGGGVLVLELAVAQGPADDLVEVVDHAHWATCASGNARNAARVRAGVSRA